MRAIAADRPVKRYTQVIGFASRDIVAGEHVHLHNLRMGALELDYAFGADAKPTQPVAAPATFQGIVRADGRVATRNYLGSCRRSTARRRSRAASPTRSPARWLAAFPNVDGVVALTHGSGCGMDTSGEAMRILRRTLGGYARHPYFAGLLVVGLGCESNQISSLFGAENLQEGPLLRSFSIQNTGGTTKTIARYQQAGGR